MNWWQQALTTAAFMTCWFFVSVAVAIIFGRICRLRDQEGPP